MLMNCTAPGHTSCAATFAVLGSDMRLFAVNHSAKRRGALKLAAMVRESRAAKHTYVRIGRLWLAVTPNKRANARSLRMHRLMLIADVATNLYHEAVVNGTC